jgi:hypothetical protein
MSGIMLGNLTVDQIEIRIGINFPEEVKIFMKENNQSEAANIKKGKWHCFDIPFHIVCGDVETATKIYNSVKEKSKEVKEVLQFSITAE